MYVRVGVLGQASAEAEDKLVKAISVSRSLCMCAGAGASVGHLC